MSEVQGSVRAVSVAAALMAVVMQVACGAKVVADGAGGQASTCTQNGGPCAASSDCCSDACVGGICGGSTCLPDGGSCTYDSDCCSYDCSGGVCGGSTCVPDGGSCKEDVDCCSYDCSGGICGGSPCLPNGAGCYQDADCCNHDCSGGVCGGGGYCGALQWSTDPTCESCVEGYCCQELLLCDVGTSCYNIFQCVNGCPSGDSGCINACQKGPGVKELSMLAECVESSCYDQCLSGEICDSGLQASDPACGSCLGNHCCYEFDTCVMDSTCLDCLIGQLFGPVCDNNAPLAEATSCYVQHCSVECG